MKHLHIIIFLILVTSCNSSHFGIKRTETQTIHTRKIYGGIKKIGYKKRKIEYRIFDRNKLLIELGHYGERGGYTESKWNPIDSTLSVTSVSTRDYKKLDFIKYFSYDAKDNLIMETFWYCRNNKPIYLSVKDTFDYENNLMKSTSFDFDGNIIASEIMEIKYPFELSQEIYNQKITSVGERIISTKEEDFKYDDQNRLIKVLHKDEYDNILGFTKYKYKELKKKNGS